jgi:TonB family protein
MLLLSLLIHPATAQDGPADPPTEAPAELPIVEGPAVVTYVEAVWPPGTREQGLEAVVKMRIELDAEGEVANVEVTEPQGNGFDEAAVDAVLAMEFSPARTAEGPVPVVFEFAYGFRFVEEVKPPEEEAPKPVNLEGRIREMGTRVPLAGISVVVDGTDLVATTDAEGTFQIRKVPLGPVTVRLLGVDHVTLEKPVEMVDGQVSIVDL